jgi:hypothetical protein
MIGFIGTSVTSSLNNAIDIQFPSAHALGLSVSTSRLLATDLNTETSTFQVTMKSSCYFAFSHSVLLCPNMYSTNLHNLPRTRSIIVLVPSTAELI